MHRKRGRKGRGLLLTCLAFVVATALCGCRIVVGPRGAARAAENTPTPGMTPNVAPPTAAFAQSTPRWSIEHLPSSTPSATPTATATATATATPEPVTYVVQDGDTLERVAERFGVTVVEVMAANNLGNPDSIRVGERLVIPNATAAAPSATPQPRETEGTPTPSALDESTRAPVVARTRTPSVTAYPTSTPYPTYTPYPTQTPRPTYTPYPTYTPLPTFTPPAAYTPRPTYTPAPTAPPATSPGSASQSTTYSTPTSYVAPTYTPYPTYTPFPSVTPTHTNTATPRPTDTIYPTYTPQPTYTPYPTFTPAVPIKGPQPPSGGATGEG